jgi:L-alanine-DL-glutamate epimerase-like enolase superfamily enzyme
MLKSAALPIAGAFALPALSVAIQEKTTPYQRPKLKITDWKGWVKEGEIIEKGYVTVPDRPGIGV